MYHRRKWELCQRDLLMSSLGFYKHYRWQWWCHNLNIMEISRSSWHGVHMFSPFPFSPTVFGLVMVHNPRRSFAWCLFMQKSKLYYKMFVPAFSLWRFSLRILCLGFSPRQLRKVQLSRANTRRILVIQKSRSMSRSQTGLVILVARSWTI